MKNEIKGMISKKDKKIKMVRKERLELSHLTAPEPKSGASTNFATSAFLFVLKN